MIKSTICRHCARVHVSICCMEFSINMGHNKLAYFNRFNIFQVVCVCIPCNEFGTETWGMWGHPTSLLLVPFFDAESKDLHTVWRVFTYTSRYKELMHINCKVLVLIHWWRTKKLQNHKSHITSTDAWFCFFLHCDSVWNFQHALSFLFNWSS